ncbi:MAG: energy transducer TonB [Betaproteobacteria bacterium]|nr:energy transducer TonB [Betaproteobacteria bacterium]
MAGAEPIGGGGFTAPWLRRRALRAALVVSVLLHGAVLLGLPELIEARRQAWFPAPLSARLVQPPAPAPPPQPEPRTAEPAPGLAKPAPRAAPAPAKAAPAPSPAPQAVESPRTEPVIADPATAPSPAATAIDTAPAKAEPRPAAPVAAPAPGFDEAAAVAQYRLELMQVASGLKTYPRIAQENGWEGRVELRITVGAGGAISALTVKRGTGYAVLDQHALDMLRRAQPRTPLPAGLRGREFTIEVPVVFGLKDG